MRDARLDELAENLAAVRAEIPDGVGLVAVSKTWPAADVLRLASLGVTDFGESYAQEAVPKAAQVAEAGVAVRWHHVGQIQRNKARQIAGYADVVQSIDRLDVCTAVARAARRAGRVLDALIQVRFDTDRGRGGCGPGEVEGLAECVDDSVGLTLRGLMTVAPPGVDPAPVFRELAALGASLVAEEYLARPWLSMGMSGDLAAAIREGATHVRVGTALFGSRTPPSG